jgi:hypothetical protein
MWYVASKLPHQGWGPYGHYGSHGSYGKRSEPPVQQDVARLLYGIKVQYLKTGHPDWSVSG